MPADAGPAGRSRTSPAARREPRARLAPRAGYPQAPKARCPLTPGLPGEARSGAGWRRACRGSTKVSTVTGNEAGRHRRQGAHRHRRQGAHRRRRRGAGWRRATGSVPRRRLAPRARCRLVPGLSGGAGTVPADAEGGVPADAGSAGEAGYPRLRAGRPRTRLMQGGGYAPWGCGGLQPVPGRSPDIGPPPGANQPAGRCRDSGGRAVSGFSGYRRGCGTQLGTGADPPGQSRDSGYAGNGPAGARKSFCDDM